MYRVIEATSASAVTGFLRKTLTPLEAGAKSFGDVHPVLRFDDAKPCVVAGA